MFNILQNLLYNFKILEFHLCDFCFVKKLEVDTLFTGLILSNIGTSSLKTHVDSSKLVLFISHTNSFEIFILFNQLIVI